MRSNASDIAPAAATSASLAPGGRACSSSIDSTDRSYPQWELGARPRLVDEVRAFSMITGYECGMAVARGELPLTWISECGPGSPRARGDDPRVRPGRAVAGPPGLRRPRP